MNLLAQREEPIGTIGEGGNLGPFADMSAWEPVQVISTIVSKIIGVMTIAAGIWFLFQLIIGGMSWITSGGDKAKLQQARDRLTNSVVGLIIVVMSWAFLSLAGKFFGVDFTLTGGSPF